MPGEYAQMLATRPELQVATDWMLVPAARNLHWRYEVLHSAFMTCKQKVAPGESLQQNLDELIAAARKIWERIAKNTVIINGKKQNINGNIGMLFSADGITAPEKCASFLLEHHCKYLWLSSNSTRDRALLLWLSNCTW